MGVFRDLELEWRGTVYKVKAHRVMGAISRIEEVVTLPELREYALRNTAPLAKLSMAFGAVLRYAGANVSDEEVYAASMEDAGGNDSGVLVAVMAIMQIMIPPASMQAIKDEEEGADSKNSNATTALALSKRHTKRRSRGENG